MDRQRRSSSLTNPVIKLTHSTSRPLPSLPSFNEKSTLINTPTCNDDDTSTYNAACDTDDIPMENIAKVDNDIETAMLHWKRASTLTLSKSVVHAPNSAIEEKENYNSFFTEDKELWSSASIFGDIEAILKKPSMQENCQHTADQLWNDDETVVPVKEVAASFFSFSLITLQHLEQAFRCVCGKLYFKAEAQEIDRILQAFAYRYWCCNKQSKLLYNAGKLHIVQGLGHHRMSRSEFCENTMATITNSIFLGEQHNKLTWEHDMESYLKETYTSVKFQGILQPSSVKTNEPTIAKESSGVATTTKSPPLI